MRPKAHTWLSSVLLPLVIAATIPIPENDIAIRGSPVSLPNLPTISVQSVCTEIMDNGHAVYHVKTGASCTYNMLAPTPTLDSESHPKSTWQCFVKARPRDRKCDPASDSTCIMIDDHDAAVAAVAANSACGQFCANAVGNPQLQGSHGNYSSSTCAGNITNKVEVWQPLGGKLTVLKYPQSEEI